MVTVAVSVYRARRDEKKRKKRKKRKEKEEEKGGRKEGKEEEKSYGKCSLGYVLELCKVLAQRTPRNV